MLGIQIAYACIYLSLQCISWMGGDSVTNKALCYSLNHPSLPPGIGGEISNTSFNVSNANIYPVYSLSGSNPLFIFSSFDLSRFRAASAFCAVKISLSLNLTKNELFGCFCLCCSCLVTSGSGVFVALLLKLDSSDQSDSS